MGMSLDIKLTIMQLPIFTGVIKLDLDENDSQRIFR